MSEHNHNVYTTLASPKCSHVPTSLFPTLEPDLIPDWTNHGTVERVDSGCFDSTDSPPKSVSPPYHDFTRQVPQSPSRARQRESERLRYGFDSQQLPTHESHYKYQDYDLDQEFDYNRVLPLERLSLQRSPKVVTRKPVYSSATRPTHDNLVPPPLTPRSAASTKFHNAVERNKQLYAHELALKTQQRIARMTDLDCPAGARPEVYCQDHSYLENVIPSSNHCECYDIFW